MPINLKPGGKKEHESFRTAIYIICFIFHSLDLFTSTSGPAGPYRLFFSILIGLNATKIVFIPSVSPTFPPNFMT